MKVIFFWLIIALFQILFHSPNSSTSFIRTISPLSLPQIVRYKVISMQGKIRVRSIRNILINAFIHVLDIYKSPNLWPILCRMKSAIRHSYCLQGNTYYYLFIDVKKLS